MYVYIYVCVCFSTCVCVSVCVFAHDEGIHACLHAENFVDAYIHVCIRDKHTYIHTERVLLL